MTIKPYTLKNQIVKKLQMSPDETGYVNVNAFTALGALPIKDAKVSIYTWNELEEEKLIHTVMTDENGKAPIIELPIILNHGITSPEGRTEYHLVIEADGYHTVIIINVEVYPGIANQFSVNLTPLPKGEDKIDKTINIPIQDKNL